MQIKENINSKIKVANKYNLGTFVRALESKGETKMTNVQYSLNNFVEELNDVWDTFSEEMKECLSKVITGESKTIFAVDIKRFMQDGLNEVEGKIIQGITEDGLRGYKLGVQNCLNVIESLYGIIEKDEVYVINPGLKDYSIEEISIEEII
jgi:hypothetical protein